MNENNFICIKINSWLSTIEFRQHFFLSIDFFLSSSFQQLILSNLIWSNEIPSAFLSITGFIQINILTANFFEIKRKLRQHSFLSSAHTDQIWIFFSWNNPSKTTLYKNFWWFLYRRIFPLIFLHGLNFEFHFNSFYLFFYLFIKCMQYI